MVLMGISIDETPVTLPVASFQPDGLTFIQFSQSADAINYLLVLAGAFVFMVGGLLVAVESFAVF